MKKAMVVLILFACTQAQAQNYFSETSGKLKIGGGYASDFPGLNGYAIIGEYIHALSDNLEGGFGVKRINMSGYPRTASVNEYTKANALDFNLYFLPLSNETGKLRIGAGYSFSFYKTRRSYPVVESQGAEKRTSWPVQDAKGRSAGITLSVEYEYILSPDLSLGAKASFCKAYDHIYYFGPYFSVRL